MVARHLSYTRNVQCLWVECEITPAFRGKRTRVESQNNNTSGVEELTLACLCIDWVKKTLWLVYTETASYFWILRHKCFCFIMTMLLCSRNCKDNDVTARSRTAIGCWPWVDQQWQNTVFLCLWSGPLPRPLLESDNCHLMGSVQTLFGRDHEQKTWSSERQTCARLQLCSSFPSVVPK